jgi:ATP-dependent exoDNAse (exonuclease V) beta subunit
VSETAERLVGVLIHAWLAHWATTKEAGLVLPAASLVQSQLQALGLPGALRQVAAEEVLYALVAMRDSEKGRWLLSQPHRKVEWALLNASQAVSIMDLAIERVEDWLVVDYKTARPGPQESLGQFEARMLARYRGQLQRYVTQLQAFDDRPVQAALYFPRDDLWLTV